MRKAVPATRVRERIDVTAIANSYHMAESPIAVAQWRDFS